ncbi:MAG: methyl-accepting chemotaxis protein [Treponema sp.]|nr:methyl-accepting chemotaxis protein [Treponema sp.]
MNEEYEKIIYKTSIRPSLFGLLINTIYMFYFARLPYSTMKPSTIILCVLIFILVTLFFQLVLLKFTNHFLSYKLSVELSDINNFNQSQRTSMAIKLMKLPFKVCLHVAIMFLIASFTIIAIFFFGLSIPISCTILSIIPAVYSAFNTGVMAFCDVESWCTEINNDLIQKGIDSDIVHDRKVFGMKMYTRVFYHVIIPVFFSMTIFLIYMTMQNFFPIEKASYTTYFILLLIFNLSLCVMTASLFFRHIYHSILDVNQILKRITSANVNEDMYLPTDLGTELSYSVYVINDIIAQLQDIMVDIKKTSDNLFKATLELTESSKTTADNSVIQASNVKDCVNTMAEIKLMLKDISTSINNVSQAADASLYDVHEGSELLNMDIGKMSEIAQANLDTIMGIKNLSEKIDTVWNIISTIDSIAEKTRIIAFNAEIEATSAGESGENFHIVANEIRRLATTITDSTKEIRDRITGIQHSSDNLIITSEGGTEKIREENEMLSTLEEDFNKLKTSSEITSESAADILQITNSQDSSFMQIMATLKQLSEGFDDFSQSAKTINDSSQNIKGIADCLNEIQNRGGNI